MRLKERKKKERKFWCSSWTVVNETEYIDTRLPSWSSYWVDSVGSAQNRASTGLLWIRCCTFCEDGTFSLLTYCRSLCPLPLDSREVSFLRNSQRGASRCSSLSKKEAAHEFSLHTQMQMQVKGRSTECSRQSLHLLLPAAKLEKGALVSFTFSVKLSQWIRHSKPREAKAFELNLKNKQLSRPFIQLHNYIFLNQIIAWEKGRE